MPFIFCKLNPPRPSFAQDMSEAEAALMRDHIAYWSDLAAKGIVVVFGPVADPKGAWGAAIVEVAMDSDAQALTANDPVIRKALGFQYEIYPMPKAITRK